MPISISYIATREAVVRWSHLQDIDIPPLRDEEVMLLIGLKENSSLIISLEYRAGRGNEAIAIRYSLG